MGLQQKLPWRQIAVNWGWWSMKLYTLNEKQSIYMKIILNLKKYKNLKQEKPSIL